ncbi:MAG: hypothetical protein ACD_15C00165G0003 [uncultured bacterium]|nr:MAG: hypothetical protein ACD_15C00165G0003 [uncultured bacterium]HCU70342.1 hypothetical protein [Candidatus Moranbacteria bacterium]
MKIIIVEGIATSGKTSVKNKIMEALTDSGKSFSVVEEENSLMPILHNTDGCVAINWLRKIINEALEKENDFIIFDRLFFTHIFRTNSAMEDFREIENMVVGQALLVFLAIDEEEIPRRIAQACKHRGEEWSEYVSKKGSETEIYQYYIEQQRKLFELLKQTSLEYKIYNTTNNDFDEIAKNILEFLPN